MTNKEAKEILEWELNNFEYTDNEFVEATKVAIKALEERPKGKWIEERDKRGHLITRKCPICKAFHGGMTINFCPNCGADMRGDV